MLHLDTAAVQREERAEAFVDALSSTGLPTRVAALGPARDVRARVEHWQLGAGGDLVRVASTGHQLTRAPRHLRAAAPERVALALHLRGSGQVEHAGRTWVGRPTELVMVDLTRPYDYTVRGSTLSQSFTVDVAQLGLPVDVVRAALPRVAGSPLHGLVHRHLVDLPGAAEQVEGTPAAALLGGATVELARALLVSAVQDDRRAADALADSLFTRVTGHLHRHLHEPDLSAARVAAEHATSVRHVHALFARRGTTLGRWVMGQRLDGARRQLVGLPTRPEPLVSTVARAWGFPDPGHFARRFREAYGMSPREWQRLARHEGAGRRDAVT